MATRMQETAGVKGGAYTAGTVPIIHPNPPQRAPCESAHTTRLRTITWGAQLPSTPLPLAPSQAAAVMEDAPPFTPPPAPRGERAVRIHVAAAVTAEPTRSMTGSLPKTQRGCLPACVPLPPPCLLPPTAARGGDDGMVDAVAEQLGRGMTISRPRAGAERKREQPAPTPASQAR
jgi:hypothetical protein